MARVVRPRILFRAAVLVCAVLVGSTWGLTVHATVLRRVLVPQATASVHGAMCLDGSLPGYFINASTASTKWVIHIEGAYMSMRVCISACARV